MGVALNLHGTAQYLTATLSGPAQLEDFFSAIDALATATKAQAAARLLVDLRGVTEQFRFTDHFAIGERVLWKLGHLERMASLVPEAKRTGTSERVANRLGLRLRVFTSEAAAVAWLSEP
jgi:hypothetical protein